MLKCFLVSGKVQGVGFRFWTLRRVSEIGGISGYVCNLPSGDVLVLAESTEDKMRQLEISLYKGPLFARVDSIKNSPELISYFPPVENCVFKRL
ncbi:MAG: acylphosphatase [Alphaproteobacteria bacterium]|nr:acylphosphatase [Alphaproteobacteria bacterium]MDY4690443.1 acylphosphatase [Alphaproteobacteria bacterium]